MLSSFFCIKYTIIKKYYPGEPATIHIIFLINITQENNKVIITKKCKGKLPLLCGNRERVILFYYWMCCLYSSRSACLYYQVCMYVCIDGCMCIAFTFTSTLGGGDLKDVLHNSSIKPCASPWFT